MSPRFGYNPKEYFRERLPNKVRRCRGCKSDRLEMGFEKARDLMENETNIIEQIKTRRYFNTALRFIFSKKMRMKLKKKGRYTVVNPDAIFMDKKVDKKESEDDDSGEFTEGFYSHESDEYAHEHSHEDAQIVQENQTALNLVDHIYKPDQHTQIKNPELIANQTKAKVQKKQRRDTILPGLLRIKSRNYDSESP